MSLDAKIAERLEMFRLRTHDHHDHIWDDMSDEKHTDREGNVIEWYRCAICNCPRFKRKDVR